jgi:hypothetical protein
MSWLVRKISRAKWEASIGSKKISADAVTGDLRTKNDELSLWAIASSAEAELEKVAIAIAASGERVDSLDVAWIASRELRKRKIALRSSLGVTAAVAYRNLHVDAEELELASLSKIARVLARSVRESEQLKRFTRAEVKRLLQSSIEMGATDRNLLDPKLRTELGI